MLFWPQPHSDGRRKYLHFTLRRERSLVLKHRDVSAYLVSCRENSTLLKWMIGPRQEGWMNSFVTLLSNLKPPSVPWQKYLDFAEANPCKIQWGRRCHQSQSKASIGHIARGRGRFNALLRRFEGATAASPYLLRSTILAQTSSVSPKNQEYRTVPVQVQFTGGLPSSPLHSLRTSDRAVKAAHFPHLNQKLLSASPAVTM